MNIIRERAEEQLIQAQGTGDQDRDRAIHVAVVPQEVGLELHPLPEEAFMNGLIDIMQESNCNLYICYDGDIVLWGRGVTAQHSKRVKALAIEWGKADEVSFYERTVNWYKFTMLCHDKLNAKVDLVKRLEDQVRRDQWERTRHAILNQPLIKELTGSIQERRANRKANEILVVEDDLFSGTLVRNALKGDYVVNVVEDGRRAISEYVKQAPNIMFLDIGLPDVSGHDILQRILQIDPEAYIVMLSGQGDRENVLKAVQAGARGFVGKPFNKEKLLKYIQTCPSINANSREF